MCISCQGDHFNLLLLSFSLTIIVQHVQCYSKFGLTSLFFFVFIDFLILLSFSFMSCQPSDLEHYRSGRTTKIDCLFCSSRSSDQRPAPSFEGALSAEYDSFVKADILFKDVLGSECLAFDEDSKLKVQSSLTLFKARFGDNMPH